MYVCLIGRDGVLEGLCILLIFLEVSLVPVGRQSRRALEIMVEIDVVKPVLEHQACSPFEVVQ